MICDCLLESSWNVCVSLRKIAELMTFAQVMCCPLSANMQEEYGCVTKATSRNVSQTKQQQQNVIYYIHICGMSANKLVDALKYLHNGPTGHPIPQFLLLWSHSI